MSQFHDTSASLANAREYNYSLPIIYNRLAHTDADRASVQELGRRRAMVPLERAQWLTMLHRYELRDLVLFVYRALIL